MGSASTGLACPAWWPSVADQDHLILGVWSERDFLTGEILNRNRHSYQRRYPTYPSGSATLLA